MTTQTLPLLPLKNVAIFPELIQALIVGRPASLAAVKAAIDHDRKLVTVLQKDRDQENPDREGLFDIGTLATVTRVEQRDGGAQVIVRGVRRVRVEALSAPPEEDAPAEVEVVELPTPALPEAGEQRAKATALIRENLDIARQVAHMMSQNPDQLFQQMVGSIEDPVTQMYRLVELARNIEQNDKQRVLEIDEIQQFLEAIHRLLRQELAVVEMQRDLQSQAREEAEHGQREHLLRQQKRVIEEALGEDGDDEDIAELRKQRDDVGCIVVGEGPELDGLRELRGELGLDDCVVLTGQVPHSEVHRYYSLIDVFVVPRRDDRAARLVTPLKPFEAMAMELPIVVSDLPALSEVAAPGERGLSFVPEDPASLAATVAPLLDDPALRKRFGAAGRDWVQRERTWAANGKRYVEAYGRVGVRPVVDA